MYPQCNPTYTDANVSICNNSAIAAKLASCELTAAQKSNVRSAFLAEYASIGITSADILDEASVAYNCHAYAWHLTEGHTNRVWVNQTEGGNANLSKYWSGTNPCFIECTEANAEKIFYYAGDHSAVKSTVSGKYESKWGPSLLVRHAPTVVPPEYIGTSRRYYKRNSITISGPSAVCSGSSGAFTVSNAPSGYTWSKSSNLTLSSTSGNTATFTANASGPAWVSIMVGSTEVKRKTLYAGVPQTADFSGSCGGPETGSTGLFTGSALPASSSSGVDAFEWTVNPGWTVVSHPNFPGSITMGNVRITRTSSSASTTTPVYVRAHNSCGWSSGKQVGTLSSSSYYSMSAWPNPVSDVLSVLIEEDTEALALFETAGATLSGAGTAGRAKSVYTIGLYSITGGTPALQASANEAGTVQLNISSLPNGIYVLHVHDGTANPPLTRRIVVSH
jgi:hypothetical protein